MSDQHLLAEITQSAVIFYNGKILVLELTNFPWKRVFPGGRINQWEYWLEGLKRELKEEIGIEKFEVNNVISIDNWDTKKWSQMGMFYSCTIWENKVLLSSEHSNYRRVGINDNLDEIDFYHPFLRKLVNYVMNNQGNINGKYLYINE